MPQPNLGLAYPQSQRSTPERQDSISDCRDARTPAFSRRYMPRIHLHAAAQSAWDRPRARTGMRMSGAAHPTTSRAACQNACSVFRCLYKTKAVTSAHGDPMPTLIINGQEQQLDVPDGMPLL